MIRMALVSIFAILLSTTLLVAQSSLPECKKSPTKKKRVWESWSNCIGQYVVDFSSYRGAWLNGKMHGQGYYTNKNGITYEGEFKDGHRACGTLTSQGSKRLNVLPYVFTGCFNERNLPHGKGKKVFSDGTIWVGRWDDGAFYGKIPIKNDNKRVQSKVSIAFKDLSLADRISIQYNLRVLNLYSGALDGLFGPKTEKAIKEYANLKLNKEFNKNSEKDMIDLLRQILLDFTPSAKIVQKQNKNPEVPKKEVIKKNEKRVRSTGSAFSIQGDPNIVVTSQHVVKDCSRIELLNEVVETGAYVMASDPNLDLAILRLDRETSVGLPLSDETPFALQSVIVAGFPFGDQISSGIKYNLGIISALTGPLDDTSLFQIDAAVQPGNSGGPVINENGSVIGVTRAKLDEELIRKVFGVAPENINFAVNLSSLKGFLDKHAITYEVDGDVVRDRRSVSKIASEATLMVICY